MKKILITLLASAWLVPAMAQLQLERQVNSSGGNYSSGGGISISSTFGESVTTTFVSSALTLTQGFQQPGDLSINVDELTKSNLTFIAYPNPVNEILTLALNSSSPGTVNVRLIDVLGREVKPELSRLLTSQQTENIQIDMGNLAPGLYRVSIYEVNANATIQSISILKSN